MNNISIAKYSTHNIVPANRPIKKSDVDSFISKEKQGKEKPAKKKKNKEPKNEECKQD